MWTGYFLNWLIVPLEESAQPKDDLTNQSYDNSI
jgi:hypothetical protein